MAVGQLNTFIDRLMEHIPEENRAAARSAYSRLSDEVATLEGATERVRTTEIKQRQWWEENKDAVEERNRLRAAAMAQPTVQPIQGLSEDEITKRINAMREETMQTGLGLVTELSTLVGRHQHEFGEALDTRTLTQEALNKGLTIQQHYDATVADRRAVRAQADFDAKLAAARQEGEQAGLARAMAANGQALPYPVNGQGPVTTLQGLRGRAEGTPNPFSLDAAVATAMDVANKQQ